MGSRSTSGSPSTRSCDWKSGLVMKRKHGDGKAESLLPPVSATPLGCEPPMRQGREQVAYGLFLGALGVLPVQFPPSHGHERISTRKEVCRPSRSSSPSL